MLGRGAAVGADGEERTRFAFQILLFGWSDCQSDRAGALQKKSPDAPRPCGSGVSGDDDIRSGRIRKSDRAERTEFTSLR